MPSDHRELGCGPKLIGEKLVDFGFAKVVGDREYPHPTSVRWGLY